MMAENVRAAFQNAEQAELVRIAYLVDLKAENRTLKELHGFSEAGEFDTEGVPGTHKRIFSMSSQSFVLTVCKRGPL